MVNLILFMKLLSLACLAALLPLPSLHAERPPNIVLIFADDMGWNDAGFRGSKYYETPSLDRLAGEGTEFTRAYTSPSCAPSRAALLSGQYSPRHGVFMVSLSDRGDRTKQRLIPIPNVESLPSSSVTLAETLQEAGYATALIGKWHLGGEESSPEKHGFQLNVAGYKEGTPPSYFSPYNIPTLPDGPEGEYLTDRLTKEAIAFMEKEKDRPFFLYLPHYAVHVPLQAKPAWIEHFKKKPSDGPHNDPVYAAMLRNMDDNIGHLLAALKRLELEDNTFVIFVSDNGGQLGITAQPPLREGKGWLYEGGVRVPMIIRAPRQANSGGKSDSPVHLVDLYPTILEWAGIHPPQDYPLDGVSIAKQVSDPSAALAERGIYWHFPGYQPLKDSFRITPSSMVINGKWKLIEHFEDNTLELYDLENDIGETINLADTQPEKAAQLKAQLKSWRAEINAPVPTEHNPLFRPTP